jgi:hypothetical protein
MRQNGFTVTPIHRAINFASLKSTNGQHAVDNLNTTLSIALLSTVDGAKLNYHYTGYRHPDSSQYESQNCSTLISGIQFYLKSIDFVD